jgi:hypothetical protein
MREALAERAGARGRYTAQFKCWGKGRAYKGPAPVTLLLVDVRDAQGELVTDHLWFTLTVEFCRARLRSGDRIAFDGRSAPYEKGYRGRRDDGDDKPAPETDYRLSHPTRVEVLERNPKPEPLGHTCHARACTVHVPPELLMCAVHWAMVPRDLQRAVWDHYRPGQERDKDPSPWWVDAADAAIIAVAQREGTPAAKVEPSTAPGQGRLFG